MKSLPLANSLAAISGISWIFCAVLIWLFPSFSLYLTKIGLMGIEGLNLTGFNLGLNDFIVGLIFILAAAWIFGFIWGWLYQKFSRTSL